MSAFSEYQSHDKANPVAEMCFVGEESSPIAEMCFTSQMFVVCTTNLLPTSTSSSSTLSFAVAFDHQFLVFCKLPQRAGSAPYQQGWALARFPCRKGQCNCSLNPNGWTGTDLHQSPEHRSIAAHMSNDAWRDKRGSMGLRKQDVKWHGCRRCRLYLRAASLPAQLLENWIMTLPRQLLTAPAPLCMQVASVPQMHLHVLSVDGS